MLERPKKVGMPVRSSVSFFVLSKILDFLNIQCFSSDLIMHCINNLERKKLPRTIFLNEANIEET